jgi:hypothetical protein
MWIRRQLRWGTAATVLALLASVPPLGTLVFERWATHTGRLQVGTRTQRSESLDVNPPTEARTP